MNYKNYDSEFCGSLPLHQINLIQPYGYLLVLEKDTLKVVQASENVSAIFGLPVEETIGSAISTYLQEDEVKSLSDRFQTGIRDKIPLSMTFDLKEYIALVHSKGDYLIVELEQAGQKSSFLQVQQQLKFVMAEINLAQSVKEASEIMVRALKKIAGFDRVLMYQFDKNWNGSVIAEVREEGMEPYIGLKFPASDIPRQARALYLKNPYRLIPNREYTPVRLYPVINPLTNSFIDLSDCNLRSVAAVHLEYMQNMGIKASMSIRVIKDDKLWGLISCHHQEPQYLPYETCSLFELLSEVISSKITSITNREEFQERSMLQNQRTLLVDQVYSTADLFQGLLNNSATVAGLFNSGGAVLSFKGRTQSVGEVPEDEEIVNIRYWLQDKKDDNVFAENSLASAFEPARAYVQQGSGLLSIPINRQRGDFLMLFRPEVVKKVNWGGNPEQAINFEDDGKKYHPRNSFKQWQETLKQHSEPWSKEELEIAEGLRSFIFEYSSKHLE